MVFIDSIEFPSIPDFCLHELELPIRCTSTFLVFMVEQGGAIFCFRPQPSCVGMGFRPKMTDHVAGIGAGLRGTAAREFVNGFWARGVC